MAKSKTEEYREFLQDKLKSGMYKMQAARELNKKYPNLSMTTCITHVYQWFPAKYNKNYDRKAAAMERKAIAEEAVVSKTAPVPRTKKINREESATPKPETKAVSKPKSDRPAKKPIPKNKKKSKTVQHKSVDGAQVFF